MYLDINEKTRHHFLMSGLLSNSL